MRTPCPNQFIGCPEVEPYADLHHLHKESEADTHLKSVYCNLGANVIQLCRCVHKEFEATVGWLPYPEDEVMQDIVASEQALGNINLSRSSKKKLGM